MFGDSEIIVYNLTEWTHPPQQCLFAQEVVFWNEISGEYQTFKDLQIQKLIDKLSLQMAKDYMNFYEIQMKNLIFGTPPAIQPDNH